MDSSQNYRKIRKTHLHFFFMQPSTINQINHVLDGGEERRGAAPRREHNPYSRMNE
jgi:hypothetical protein